MDWKRARRPYNLHTLPLVHGTILVTGKNFCERLAATEAVLTTEALVELTTKVASVWASAVDPSDSMMYCKPD